MLSHPDARNVVIDALTERVRNLHIEADIIAGEGGAIPWAILVADRLDLPFVYLRKPKDHGLGKRIEGDLPADKDVVLIEDLISTGGSAVRAVETLREEGNVNVSDVVAIFSYGMVAAQEKQQESRIAFHPLSNFETLLKVALEQGRMDEDEIANIARFAEDPQAWSAT